MSKEEETQKSLDEQLEAAADEVFGSEVEATDQTAALEKEADDISTPAEEGEPPVEEAEATDETPPEEPGEEQKPAEEKPAEEKPAEEEPDPYAIPEDMKGRTRDRFEKLTGNLREANEKVAKQEEVITGFRDVIQRSGLTPDEVQGVLSLGNIIKTDPTKALETLKGMVEELSAEVGIVPPGADPLKDHPDLIQRVQDREILQEDAEIIARARFREMADKKAREKIAQQNGEAQRAASETRNWETRVAGGQSAVAAYVETIKKNPDFKVIEPHLADAARFAAQNLAPEKWLEYIQGQHDKIREVARASAAQDTGRVTPILSGGAPRGGEKEPQSLEELADQML